jgi:hypothetical protein
MRKWAHPQDLAALLAGIYAALSPIWTTTVDDATSTMIALGVVTAAVALLSLARPDMIVSEGLIVDPDRGSLRIDSGGRVVAVTRAHLMAGAIDHGYALTVHQAQGLTVDRALLLGSTSLYQEAGYVGLSRARDRTDLILAERTDDFAYTDDDVDRPRPAPTPAQPALDAINRALERSKGQHTAHDLSR